MLVKRARSVHLDENIKLNNVLHFPDFSCNLMSIHKLTCDLNCMVTYQYDYCTVQDQALRRTIHSSSMLDRVYEFKGFLLGVSYATTHEDTTKLWHSRMGHPSTLALQQLSQLLECNFNFNKIN
uniref:GAG-pre-integrase domain-containing protein n=1 Tax=Cajanus cajan TaxID=3821 RepID=A0A151TIQ0_CAJCA|nr:hypothetical protein KK1_013247 [Cajanus cajan]